MNEIVLTGCTPTPLASYLKALGVLRLVSKVQPKTRAAWRGNHLVLGGGWTDKSLEEFFINDYQPTPILASWNGGSGFYEKDNKTALNAIKNSTSPRLALYRESIECVEQTLGSIDRSASPKDAAKVALLCELRNVLPDAALEWVDASVLLSGGTAKYPPLLGTGGNDGRLDFTNNFMQRLVEILSPDGEVPSTATINFLPESVTSSRSIVA